MFGIVTDLGTRLLSPWRNEVVIEQGPPLSERWETGRDYLYEHGSDLLDQGRGYLDQGREYLDKGMTYASRLAEQARSRLPDYDDVAEYAESGRKRARRYASDAAEAARAQLPDYDDVADLAQSGRKRARRFAANLRSNLPDIDPADLAKQGRREAADFAKQGRRQATRLAENASSYVPEIPTSGLSRALKWLLG